MLYWFLSYSIYIICWIASYCKGHDNVLSETLQCIVTAFASGSDCLRLEARNYRPSFSDISNMRLMGRMAFSATSASTCISGASFRRQS